MVADISLVQHQLSTRPSSRLIAFVMVAELGIGVDAAEREETIGGDGVRLGQHALDVGVDGTLADDGEEPHSPLSLPANMHDWNDAAPQQTLGSMLFRPMLPHHKQRIGQHIFVVLKSSKNGD